MTTLLGVLAVAPANAAYPPWVQAIRDCAFDGKLDGTYTTATLETAIHHLQADGDEYTDCRNALEEALAGGSGKHLPPPPNGIVTPSGAVAASPADLAALQTVQAAADTGVTSLPPVTAANPGLEPAGVEPVDSAYPLWPARDALIVTVAVILAVLAGALAKRRPPARTGDEAIRACPQRHAR